jgi:hypothetical protein
MGTIIRQRPWLLLLLLPFLSHLPQWALGLSTDPVWFFSYAVSGVRPGVLAGGPYLDPNMGFVTQALGTEAARDWIHGIIPWWDPYTGVGMPLAGGMQPGAFFLPFNLLLLLPGGVLWLAIAMQLLAGLTTYPLLRLLGTSQRAALLGAALYELNCTIAWTPGISAIYGGLPFLPLILWGIEMARRAEGGPQARLGVGIGIAYQILAGFPETAYLNGLLALLWAAARGAQAARPAVFAARVLTGGLLGVLLAAPLLIAFADYLQQSDIVAHHHEDFVSLTLQMLAMNFLPYVTGALGETHGSDFLANNWANGCYCGLLLPLLALAALLARRETALKLCLAGWIVLTWGRTYGIPPFASAMNVLPFMRDVEVYRYSAPSWNLAFVVLAAFGLDAVLDQRIRRHWPMLACLVLLALAGWWAWPGRQIWAWPPGVIHAVFLWWLAAILLALAGLALAALFWRRPTALAWLLLANAFIAFIIPELSGVKPGSIDQAALSFLRAQPGYARVYTLGPMLPNYGAYFGIASIDHNMLPVPRLWAGHVDAQLLPGLLKANAGGMLFWPSVGVSGAGAGPRDLRRFLGNYEDAGVRYVLDWPGAPLPGFTRVYLDNVLEIFELPAPAPYFQAAGCALSAMRRLHVMLDCKAPSVLLRRELFMPGWAARVNGRRMGVTQADGIFQSVAVPAGHSVVWFRFAPPWEKFGWLACLLGVLGLWRECGVLRKGKASKHFFL